VFGIETGDADNDGRGEIILNIGGGLGYPMYLRRLEYNPATQGFEHKMVQPGPIGLPLSAEVADVDGDGLNELVIGGAVVGGGRVFVFEATADDTFSLVWSSAFFIPGNVIDLALGPPNEFGYPIIVSSSFEGQVDLIGYDGSAYVRHLDPPLTTGSAGRQVDHGYFDTPDHRPDLLLAQSGANVVAVYERETGSAIDATGESPAGAVRLLLRPNPMSTQLQLDWQLPAGAAGKPVVLQILDPAGRLVRAWRPTPRASAEERIVWDGRDAAGHAVPTGLYSCRLRAAGVELRRSVLRIR
jgi:hypothetical protein